MASQTDVDIGRLIAAQGIGGGQWLVIRLCALVALLDGLNLPSIGLAAPPMTAELHMLPATFTLVFSAGLLGMRIIPARGWPSIFLTGGVAPIAIAC